MNTEWMENYNLLMFNDLDSTNLEAKKLAASAPIGNFIIWAKSQTEGRGRMGREWHSEAGNLYMSILLQSEAPTEDLAQLSFASALAVCDALESIAKAQGVNLDIALKWPNDVLVGGKKISGILLESVKAADKNYLIVGIGLNLENHPDIQDKPSISAAALKLSYTSVERMLNLVMSSFDKYYNIWHEGYGFAKIRELRLAKAHKLNRVITVSDGKNRISGLFEDIDLHGSIRLRMTSGQLFTLSACEVFFGTGI